MPLPARLFGPDKAEITDLESWYEHAGPERREIQWRAGYSAMEQARAWLRTGAPAVPDELWAAVEPHAPAGIDEMYGRPEHKTSLDRFGRARQHDLFGCARAAGETRLVIGVEAKACESFGGLVADRALAGPPSNKRARCNLMSRALFGRDVIEEASGAILDEELSRHGYQLWTAAVGTLIEAQGRGVGSAVLVVHQFLPADIAAGTEAADRRDWRAALAANREQLEAFESALKAAGATSRETEFVEAGTKLDLVRAETAI